MQADPNGQLPLGRRHARHGASSGLSVAAAWVVSLAYAGVLFLIPWTAIRGEPFFDLAVYLEGFDLGAYDYLDELEGLAYLFSEPLWRYIVGNLTVLLGDVPTTFNTASFAVSAIYAYVILRASRSAAVFLSAPLLIDLVLSQVRSAVAGALFFIAYLAGGTLLWIGLLAIASLIHSSAILLFALFACAIVLQRLSARWITAGRAIAVLASVLIPLAIAAAYVTVLAAVGDRRAESEAAWPGGVFVLSFGVYYLVLLLNLKRVIKHSIAIFSFLVSGLFVTLAAFDINALRFISLTYPALIASVFFLPFLSRSLLLSILFLMCGYHLALWL